MTGHELMGLLLRDHTEAVTLRGVTGVVCSIQREDGSGRSFNVTLSTQTGLVVVYVRTVG